MPLAGPYSPTDSLENASGGDAAPLAATAREIGLPELRSAPVVTGSAPFIASLSLRLLLTVALVSLGMSWIGRRWRGLA